MTGWAWPREQREPGRQGWHLLRAGPRAGEAL